MGSRGRGFWGAGRARCDPETQIASQNAPVMTRRVLTRFRGDLGVWSIADRISTFILGKIRDTWAQNF